MSTEHSSFGRNAGGYLIPVVLFALLAAAPLLGLISAPGYVLSFFTRLMIFALAALALDVILGFGAMISFGHAAFIGLGAYAVGIANAHDITDAFIGLALALAVTGLFGLVTGAISLRTRGVYLIMITLAFGQMAFFLVTSLKAYGGDDGLTLSSRSTVFGTNLLKNPYTFYYLTFTLLLACYLFCRSLIAARFGRVLRGIQDNPDRMRAIGYNPYPYQLVAYVIAGMMGGIAGYLLANQAEFVSPAFMSWQRSGGLIMMVVLGGIGTLHGAILGAAAYLITEELLSGVTEHWRLIFGPLLILVVLFARGGLIGLIPGRKHG